MDNKIISAEARNNTIGKWRDKMELVGGYKLVTFDGKETDEPMDIRFYMGRSSSASVVRCALWWHTGKRNKKAIYSNGSGSAGGCGYDKQSAAMGDALENSGIKLEQNIDGVGESAELSALNAFARYISAKRYHIVKFHG